MTKMPFEYWKRICEDNGENVGELSVNDVKFRALGFLGYKGSINDRKRSFYYDRTGIDDLTTAIARNDPNK